jgi:small subunit ribosomal protein S18
MSAGAGPPGPRGGGGYAGGHREGGYREGGHREGGYREGGYREGGHREGGFREGGHREGGYREGGYGGDGHDRHMSVKARLRARARKKARKQKKGGFLRRKVCRFCADANLKIDYRDAKTLRLFVTETGKMIPRRISGNCARHQRPLAIAIKRARQIALLPMAGQAL